MKKLEFIFVLALAVYLIISGLDIEGFSKDYNSLQDNVVRIHILANSDEKYDQELKLAVRNRILEYTNGWLSGCSSADEAIAVLSTRIDEINNIAQAKVNECGYSYTTKSEVVEMKFDDRVYDDITMPHGKYTAVRVTIGTASGHNWWCVMYPPLCIPVAVKVTESEEVKEDFFSEEEIEIMEKPKKFKVRFMLWDKLKSVFDAD